MLKLWSMFVLFFFGSHSYALVTVKKQFILKTPTVTQKDVSIYLTGNFSYKNSHRQIENCSWKEKCLKMVPSPADDHLYTLPVEIVVSSLNDEIFFKVTQGDWSHELSHHDYSPLSNLVVNIKSPSPLVLINGIEWTHNKNNVYDDLFQLDRLTVSYRGVQDYAELIILRPKTFKSGFGRYKTLYAFDGDTLYNEVSPLSGGSLDLHKVIRLDQKKFQDFIIVGIKQKDDRGLAYQPPLYPEGNQMVDFVREVALNVIPKYYPVLNDRTGRYLMGISFGARVAMATLFNHLDVFSKVAMLSPCIHSLGSFSQYIKNAHSRFKVNIPYPISAYIDFGNFEWLSESEINNSSTSGLPTPLDNYREGMERVASLFQQKEKAYNLNQFAFHPSLPYAIHSELDWSRRVVNALIFLADDKKILK